MPILAEETCLYPDNLLDGYTLMMNDRQWLAVRTKPRQEKAIARELRESHVPFYLPLVEKKLRIRNRVRTSFHPLFTGYLFLYVNDEERVRSLKTNRIVQILTVKDAAELEVDLQKIRRLIESGEELTPESELAPGRPVRINQGAFQGMEGTIKEARNGKTRVIMVVKFLNQGASLTVDNSYLELL